MTDRELIDAVAELWVTNGGDGDGLFFLQDRISARIDELLAEKQAAEAKGVKTN